MSETDCATYDGQPTDCPHCLHSITHPDRWELYCCLCHGRLSRSPAAATVPDYRDTWATPPSTAFRRTDREET